MHIKAKDLKKSHKKNIKVSPREDMVANMRCKTLVSTRKVCAKREVMLICGQRALHLHL